MNIPGFEKKSIIFNISSHKNKNLKNIKKSPIDLLLIKEKEKNSLDNTKTANIEDNNAENKRHNIIKNINSQKDIENNNFLKLKLYDDNTTSRLNIKSKGSFIKKHNLNEEIYLNYNNKNKNEYNLKKLNNKISTKNKAFIGFPNKQPKLVFIERNKNLGSIKDKKSNNPKKKVEFTDIKEMSISKINPNYINYIKTNHNRNLNSINSKRKILSVETKHTQNYLQIKNSDDNYNSMHIEHNRNLTNRLNDNNTIKEYINKSTDEIKSRNKDVNNIKINSKTLINKIDYKKGINKNISDIINKINNIDKDIKLKSLTNKENAYLLLSQSNILNLRERIIFSKATKKISSIISIKDILKSNKLFIKEKIKELEKKIEKYNIIIETHFTPSKTAIISLNIIKKEDEDNFKNFLLNNNIDEKEKEYYYKYVEILYILLEDNINEKNFGKIDINMLYNKLKIKKFNNCKDFLYEIFILQKSEKTYNEQKMDKFCEEFGKLPDFIKHQENIKKNRFISFSFFLMNEIYIYWNKLKEFLNLKNQTQYYIEYLKQKL